MKRSLAALTVALCAAGSIAIAAQHSMMGHPQYGTWGVDLSAMDKSVRPGDNFFDYVNGTWLKTAQIPPDRSSTGAFQDLRILSEKRMKAILEDLDHKPYASLTDEEKKLRDFYDAFMDQKQIDQRGLAPVQADLATFAGLKTPDDVARAMGTVKLMTLAPFDMGIDVDPKDPHAYAITVTQSGIGMPNRDYYSSNDPAIVKTRDAYKKYLATMLGMAGIPDADNRAAQVYAVEQKIAQAQWPNADRRDVDKTYNPMSISQLEQLAPQFPWKAYLGAAGVPMQSQKGERQLIVAEKSAFPKLAAIFAETPVSVWRDYLTVHYLHQVAPYLPKRFDDANFAFYGTVIQGNPQQLDRATRGTHLIDDNLGEALGKLYVAKYFPPEAKAKAEELVSNLLKAYDADIRTLPWMTEETRQKALGKLHQFTPHIGYPEKWRDYSAYQVSRDTLVDDVESGAAFEWNRELKRIDGQVDRSEWGMSPPTVNAYYTPVFNAIFFPAAILQPPFFDANADDAVNYGGIGAVIGHEISHGFDDQGSKFDGTGELNNWWTAEDRKNFEARTKELVAQYNTYEPLPGLHVNGAFTLGENIADLAGLTIAYKAYHISLGGKEAPVVDGLTGDQRFFLSMGQIWRSKYREGALRAQVLSNEHAPAEFRPIGATRNLDVWYKTFNVTPDQKYYLAPDNRVHLW
ncbi:MAG TPA: M13 family metallopeptidase [Rhizomicrobium sp.]|jgi:putative endopeptidase|nr:M13 family metallopeptidase [Rhizomicrobium sp.]